MQKARPDPHILVLNDGFKGNLNQALGIAQAFPSANVKIFDVKLKGPSYGLPSRKGTYPLSCKILSILCVLRLWRCGKKLLKFLLKEHNDIWADKFDVIISAGSVLSPVNLIFSKEKKAFSVNIMVPSVIPLKLFDFAIIPYHDFLKLRKKNQRNLIITMGAPNCITDEMLKRERERLKGLLYLSEDKEIIGVLIGGNDQNYRVSLRWAEMLFDVLKPLEGQYNFIITTSRRTEGKVVSFIQDRIRGKKSFIYAEFPGYSEGSHYPGILSLCRYILVTEDSINMVSESASCGVPVIILGVEKKKKQLIFDRTLEKLTEKGYAEYLPADRLNTLSEKIKEVKEKNFNKLNEAEECAQKILQSIT